MFHTFDPTLLDGSSNTANHSLNFSAFAATANELLYCSTSKELLDNILFILTDIHTSNKVFHYFLFIHVTFTFSRCSNLVLHTFLTPTNHLMPGLPPSLLPLTGSTAKSTTFKFKVPPWYATHVNTFRYNLSLVFPFVPTLRLTYYFVTLPIWWLQTYISSLSLFSPIFPTDLLLSLFSICLFSIQNPFLAFGLLFWYLS